VIPHILDKQLIMVAETSVNRTTNYYHGATVW